MKRLRSVFVWSARVVLLLLVWGVLAAVANYVVMPLVVRRGSVIEVPDLRNELVDDARAGIRKRGFRIVVDDERFDAEAPAGMILGQQPLPGKKAKKGRRIHVVVSAGPPTSLVPDVTAMPLEDALFAVRRAKLEADEIQYLFSDSVFAGKVMRQQPEPGLRVPRGETVTLFVSLGKEPSRYLVPGVVGLPEDQARYLILKAGLKVGNV
ncbi:MAG TPA: PASTA domain-containing protein, partial [Bacteroidetes bacterium]|nr:PASTA domain-containing protein [Bacteroidota bacterium]